VKKKYIYRQTKDSIEERSICGFRRALITERDTDKASFTVLKVFEAQEHYHKKSTEFYFVLKGKGSLTLDGEELAVEKGDLVMIFPGVNHRAEGKMEVIVVGVPAFSSKDSFRG